MIKRTAGRRMGEGGEAYRKSTYGADECAKGGSKLYQRDDDWEEVVRERLRVYDRQTKPLIEFYAKRGVLHTVDGNKGVEATFRLVSEVIDGRH